jgi:hypothetical protein
MPACLPVLLTALAAEQPVNDSNLACDAWCHARKALVAEQPVKNYSLACEGWCRARTMSWHTRCAGKMSWYAPECAACALCPDLRSPKTLNRNHEPPPHGAMAEGGTMIEAIGLLNRPRLPCYIEHWPGWIEVIHYFAPFLQNMEAAMLWLFPAAPHHSGLWFPPGRVLVCEDGLDLAIYVNFTDYINLHADVQAANAASKGGSFPRLIPDLRHTYKLTGNLKTALLEAAERRLSGRVDRQAIASALPSSIPSALLSALHSALSSPSTLPSALPSSFPSTLPSSVYPLPCPPVDSVLRSSITWTGCATLSSGAAAGTRGR